MKFTAALVEFQSTVFAIVVVKPHIVADRVEAKIAIAGFERAFPGKTVVLMAQDEKSAPMYFGPPNLLAAIKNEPLEKFPWEEFDIDYEEYLKNVRIYSPDEYIDLIVQYALTVNPEINVYDYRIKASEYDLRKQEAYNMPKIDFTPYHKCGGNRSVT